MNFETAKEIEIQIARWFGIRNHIIVPNVSWGLLLFEADILVCTQSNYLYEIEIKVSKSDLIKDAKKQKWAWRQKHDEIIKKLWFAMPEKLEGAIEHIPEKAGIFIIMKDGIVCETRKPKISNTAKKISTVDELHLAKLGVMRVWKLKQKLLNIRSKAGKDTK